MKDMRGYMCPGFDPFAEISKFTREIMREKPMILGADTFDFDDHILIEADMPGLKKEDIEITFENDMLSVKAKRELTRSKDGMKEKVVSVSRRVDDYELNVGFSDISLNVDELKASYENGVLNITIPKIVEPKAEPKKFQID